MRTGPHCGHTIFTFETAMGDSRSAMPPLICFCGLGRVWRFTIETCSTRILPVAVFTSKTRPVLPASRPVMTFTWSFLLSKMRTGCSNFFCGISNHLRRQRDDLHEFLFAQFPGNGTEDAGAHGLTQLGDEHGSV